jgi:hypothetical protein
VLSHDTACLFWDTVCALCVHLGHCMSRQHQSWSVFERAAQSRLQRQGMLFRLAGGDEFNSYLLSFAGEPTDKSLEVMRKFSEQYAKRTDTFFCSDLSVTAVVVKVSQPPNIVNLVAPALCLPLPPVPCFHSLLEKHSFHGHDLIVPSRQLPCPGKKELLRERTIKRKNRKRTIQRG